TGPIPLDEALPIATQIVDALEAAHEQGILHRDLKPANIKVRPDGTVKVLDFGLAKAMEPAAASNDSIAAARTVTSPAMMTAVGVILGTVAYMAPEQARGKAVDRRADIWAFGALLYEMLTGRRAFDGRERADVIASVITREPDWAALPATTPAALQRLLRRCLQKNPARRLHHMADARLELDEALEALSVPVSSAPTVVARRSVRTTLALAAGSVLVTIAAFSIGWFGAPREVPAHEWEGERLGGSTVAMSPHVSPDGQMVAFQAMVDGLTQVGVMRPDSGNWMILTTDRSRGFVQDMAWSRDGSHVYFDRYIDVPRGVFSVPVLGGDERLLLEDAMTPKELPDGSLLVTRINSDRVPQLHRFWPETSRIEPIAALAAPLSRLPWPALRVFPDGREAVFVGKPLGSTGTDHLWVIDLASGRSRLIAPGVTLAFAQSSFPLAVSADGQAVFFTLRSGSLHRIVTARRDGSGPVRTVLTLTHRPLLLDVSPDGTLYADQVDLPSEVFRFAPSSRALERISLPPTQEGGTVLPLTDGRLLLTTRTGGRNLIMVAAPHKNLIPFVNTQEETAAPMATLGRKNVVMLAGTPPWRKVVVVSVRDGRIIQRFTRVDGNQVIESIAGSPDGRTIFFVSAGMVWMVAGDDGEPQKVRSGDAVAVDPEGRQLLIMLNEATGVRLVRRTLAGEQEEDVPIPAYLRLSPLPIAPNAVGRDGRIALRVTIQNSWFWPAAILDPRTGTFDLLPEASTTDMLAPGWDHEGRVVTVATFTRGALWRFRPVASR
ncbi:MAG: protein kinase domain-containing protein, partial [Burkholderiales bacterium]